MMTDSTPAGFITLQQARSMATHVFVAAAVESLRARASALRVPDEAFELKERWFLWRSELFTLKAARMAFLRYVLPGTVSVLILNALGVDTLAAQALKVVFLAVELIVIVQVAVRIHEGPTAVHALYQTIWNDFDVYQSPATPQ